MIAWNDSKWDLKEANDILNAIAFTRKLLLKDLLGIDLGMPYS